MISTEEIPVLVSAETEDRSGAELINAIPAASVLRYDPNERLFGDQRRARVLIPPYRRSRRAIPLMADLPDLDLVQLLSAGTDKWKGEVPEGVTLQGCHAHGEAVAEWVLAAVLSIYRNLPTVAAHQLAGEWAHRLFPQETLYGKRVLIFGAGSIGQSVASLLLPFQVHATLMGRTKRGQVTSVDHLDSVLPHQDLLVLAAPLTPETDGVISGKRLASLPDDALIVNVARGSLIDTDSLVSELASGRLRAALDVTDPEPLPADHPLWQVASLVSPHIARLTPEHEKKAYRSAAQRIAEYFDSRHAARDRPGREGAAARSTGGLSRP